MKLGEGKKKNVSYAMQALLASASKNKTAADDESSDDADAAPAAPAAKKSKIDKLFSRQNQDVLSKHHSAMRTGKTLFDGDDDADADADADDLFKVKSIEYPSAVLDKASEADLNAPSKRSLRKIKADRKAKVCPKQFLIIHHRTTLKPLVTHHTPLMKLISRHTPHRATPYSTMRGT
jgi:hypothetical protein